MHSHRSSAANPPTDSLATLDVPAAYLIYPSHTAFHSPTMPVPADQFSPNHRLHSRYLPVHIPTPSPPHLHPTLPHPYPSSPHKTPLTLTGTPHHVLLPTPTRIYHQIPTAPSRHTPHSITSTPTPPPHTPSPSPPRCLTPQAYPYPSSFSSFAPPSPPLSRALVPTVASATSATRASNAPHSIPVVCAVVAAVASVGNAHSHLCQYNRTPVPSPPHAPSVR